MNENPGKPTNGNQHIASDRNEQVGDRPIRRNFNGIILAVFALMVVVVLAAYLFVGHKSHNPTPSRTDAAPATSSSPQ